MSAATKPELQAVTGDSGNSPHTRAQSQSYRSDRSLPVTAPERALSLAVPPKFVEAIAERVAELLAERDPQPAPEFLTVDEAAEFLRCKPQRVYDLTSQGRLPYLKDGSRVLIRRGDVLAYLGDGGAA